MDLAFPGTLDNRAQPPFEEVVERKKNRVRLVVSLPPPSLLTYSPETYLLFQVRGLPCIITGCHLLNQPQGPDWLADSSAGLSLHGLYAADRLRPHLAGLSSVPAGTDQSLVFPDHRPGCFFFAAS